MCLLLNLKMHLLINKNGVYMNMLKHQRNYYQVHLRHHKINIRHSQRLVSELIDERSIKNWIFRSCCPSTRLFLLECLFFNRKLNLFNWNHTHHFISLQFFITVMAFATFSVTYNLPQNRLQLSFTLLLTAVTFKWVVVRCLPTISYLTTLVISVFSNSNSFQRSFRINMYYYQWSCYV